MLLVVDDDPQVLAAVRRDLRSRYRESYTVISASSGEEALATIRELKARGDSLAIVISDQRMPGMQGTEVLAQSRERLPAGAARAAHGLLGHRRGHQGHQRGASRSLPVEAVGSARGMPLPGDRRSARRLAGRVSPGGEGTEAGRTPVVAAIARDQGLPCGQSHPLSLARRRAESGARRSCSTPPESAPSELPALFFEDGSALRNPEPRQVAERLGRSLSAALNLYDLVIVGAGPAGLAAAVYGASEGLRTLLLDRHAPGRPGRQQLPNRELPRVSRRRQRQRADAARGDAGAAARRRVARAARSDRACRSTADTST